jgi:hypothetical protein
MPPPLAEAITRLESLIHPSIFMPKAPPDFAAVPWRGRLTAIEADEGSL